MIELTPRHWALYFRAVSFRISRSVKGVLVCAEIFLLFFVLALAFSVDAPAMSFQAGLNLLSEPAQTLRDAPVAREGILRIKGQPVSILAVFVAPPVALLVGLTAMTFIPTGKFSGFASFFLLGFLGVGVAAIVTAILGQFEDYSPAIQQFCLAEGFIAGALASFRRFWSSGSLTENRPKGGRAL
jgi:hypothetical protein